MPASDHMDGLWNDPTERGRDFFPPPSAPRKVTGGIRLRKRSASDTSWWSQRWIGVFEAIGHGERLLRGRDYATGGQVRALDVEAGGAVRATVQGTRRTPYEVRITVRPIDPAEWIDVADILAAKVAYRAALAAGTLPDDVEAVFARAGVSLFPTLENDITFSCTCDDWATPCKHVAAVVYLLGDALDGDPLLTLQLRGVDREVLRALVVGRSAEVLDTDPVDADVPLRMSDEEFWSGPPADERRAHVDLEPPAIDAPLIRVLGAPPNWRGELDVERELTVALRRAADSPTVLDIALGIR